MKMWESLLKGCEVKWVKVPNIVPDSVDSFSSLFDFFLFAEYSVSHGWGILLLI